MINPLKGLTQDVRAVILSELIEEDRAAVALFDHNPNDERLKILYRSRVINRFTTDKERYMNAKRCNKT